MALPNTPSTSSALNIHFGNAAAMMFLNATDPRVIKTVRAGMVGIGFKAQRLANELLRGLAKKQTARPPSTVGKAPLKEQVIHFINKKMPGGLPKRPALVPACGEAQHLPLPRGHCQGSQGRLAR